MSSNGFFKNRGVDVKVSELTKSYNTAAEQVRALKGVEWQIGPGDAVALMGPSGCGKTTLLNILGGVDHPTGGEIVVGDQKLTSLSERELEKYRLHKVGFVFQFFNLIPTLTAVENLELPMLIAGLGTEERKKRTNGLLEMVGLAAKGHKRPEELSGGEQQRVAVALSLANDPSLILADEPTGNLDTENTKTISALFLSLAERHGKTVIMASHDPKAVEQFKKVYNMRDGNLV
ncbi:MAG TPA: ABC transporter ATP-binding protein [Candidatus Binatia bacterium]|jgi:putative ABC transport system ATP-binding protein|nr:ABC transporter ATP-binding protein [Candidatus Binatia bacterium]